MPTNKAPNLESQSENALTERIRKLSIWTGEDKYSIKPVQGYFKSVSKHTTDKVEKSYPKTIKNTLLMIHKL